jgi:hypothetical protein
MHQEPQLVLLADVLAPESSSMRQVELGSSAKVLTDSLRTSSASEGDLGQRLDGHLAIDLRRLRRPMADKIADLFQPKVEID